MVNKKNNLYLYLASKHFTIKDLKSEVVLIFCQNLIYNYFESRDEESQNFIEEEYKLNSEEKDLIYNDMFELQKYLSSNVLTIERLQKILSDKSSKENIMKARLVEPQSFFYNILTKKFISKIKTIFEDEKKYFVPELLVIFLIIDMKEKAYNFNKFDFIEKYDFKKLLDLFNGINIKLNRKNVIKLSTPLKDKTIISKMQYLSAYLVEELIKAKYSH